MRRVWSNLLWKEWREQRWMLGFASLLLSAAVAVGLRSRMASDQDVVSGACAVAAVLLPMLAAGALVPAARADGSLRAVLALPVWPWQVLAAKAAAGAALCAGPLVAAAAVSLAMAGGREMSAGPMAWRFVAAAAAALSLFAWMFALTVRQPTEVLAWLMSVGVLIGWGCASIAIAGRQWPVWLHFASPYAFLYVSPATAAQVADGYPGWAGFVAAAAGGQLAVAAGLWAAAATLFRRSTEGRP